MKKPSRLRSRLLCAQPSTSRPPTNHSAASNTAASKRKGGIARVDGLHHLKKACDKWPSAPSTRRFPSAKVSRR